MKNLLFILVALLGVVACKSNKDTHANGEHHEHEDHAHAHESVTPDQTLSVSNGTIYWTGTKPIGDSHTGTVAVTNGTVGLKGESLVSGSFTVDMTSIASTDLEGEMKEKLEGHLKTGDFFEVETYPTAVFEISNVEAVDGMEDVTHNVTGHLTMKGQTHDVTIPTNVLITDEKVSVVTKSFEIDRTKWGITFNSGSFVEDLVKDKMIDDMIKLNINLEATK